MKSHAKTRVLPKPAVTPVRRQPRIPTAMRMSVQPALQVGAVSDPAEREAETMAARVVGASAPTQATQPGGPPSQPKVAPLRRNAEAQPNLDELQPEAPGAEQQDFDLPDSQDVAPDDLGAEDMSELESGNPVDTGGEDSVAALRRDVAPKAVVGRMGGAAPGDVSRAVANPGSGRPLPSGLRARVEPHFSRSFKDVRLHDGPQDQDMAARIGARAFTHKTHIWLGKGESPTNTRLMAHELTHVVQQTNGADRLPINRNEVQREPVRREEDESYIAGKLEGFARYVPGYTLATVILGKTLISGKKVLKTAENLLGGLFGLHPLGTVLFDKLRETRMVQEAYDWTVQRLRDLNLTWSRVKGLIDKIWDAPWTGTLSYIKGLFQPIVTDLITFAKDVGQKVLEFAVRGALKLAGPYADKVWGVIQQANKVLHLIIEDPLRFAKNLILAIVGGFGRFAKNIFEHLKKGLLGWLFGAVADAGITMPERLDFKGLMSLVMQILGLTYANFRKQLVKKLGPTGERKVVMIEKSVEIVKILLKEGFAGIWRKMLEMIENFKSTLIGGISQMVITTIIKAGIGWLAGLSNPIGGVVKICLAIYDLIVAFLERLEQIMAVAQSIFSSIGAIARGKTEAAAKFVEETIGRTVPIVIAFLAALLGLGGISSKIKGIIKKLQAPVQKAMGKLIGFVLKKMKKLFSKIIAKLNGKRKLPFATFKIGKEDHRIFAKNKKGKVLIYVASGDGEEIDTVQAANEQELKKINSRKTELKKAAEIAKALSRETHEAETETEDDARKIRLKSAKKNQLPFLKALTRDLKKSAKELQQAGLYIDKEVGVTSETADLPALFRDEQPRDYDFEGNAGTYKDLADINSQPLKPGTEDPKRSQYYEVDHTIEKEYAKSIVENLDKLYPNAAGEQLTGGEAREQRNLSQKGRDKTATYRAGSGADFGLVGGDRDPQGQATDKFKKINEKATALPAIALHISHHNVSKSSLTVPPNQIVDEARTMGGDGSITDKLRGLLQNQLQAEIDDILKRTAADKGLPEEVKTKIERNLNSTIVDLNTSIFGLQTGIQAKKPTAEELTENANDSSRVLFETSGSEPNMLQTEGKLVPYKKRKAGIKGLLEYDHVLDKNYPDKSKDKNLLDTDKPAGATDKVLDKVGKSAVLLTNSQRARLSALKGGKLFPDTLGIRHYDLDEAGTIPLYEPLAQRVTSKTGAQESHGAMYARAPDTAFAAFAEFVKHGYASDKAGGERALHVHFADEMLKRSDKHSRIIAAEYRSELVKVPLAHHPDAKPLAKRNMTYIVENVLMSLTKVREETKNLF